METAKVPFISCLLLVVFLVSPTFQDLLKSKKPDQHRPDSAKQCNTSLVSLYSGIAVDSQQRLPMAVSTLIDSRCDSLRSSCCLDPEFDIMTRKIRGSLDKVALGIRKMSHALEVLKSQSSSKIDEFVRAFEHSENHSPESKAVEALRQALGYVESHTDDIRQRMIMLLRHMETFSVSAHCSICDADNHSELGKAERMYLNSRMCSDLYHSESLGHLVRLIEDIGHINVVDQALVSVYDMNFEMNMKHMFQLQKKLLHSQTACAEPSGGLQASEECMSLCGQLAPFNKSIMRMFNLEKAVFTVLVLDFFGPREMYEKIPNERLRESVKIYTLGDLALKPKPAERAITNYSDEVNVKYFLMPSRVDDRLNLSKMKLRFSDSLWYVSQTRQVDWQLDLGFVDILGSWVGLIAFAMWAGVFE